MAIISQKKNAMNLAIISNFLTPFKGLGLTNILIIAFFSAYVNKNPALWRGGTWVGTVVIIFGRG